MKNTYFFLIFVSILLVSVLFSRMYIKKENFQSNDKLNKYASCVTNYSATNPLTAIHIVNNFCKTLL